MADFWKELFARMPDWSFHVFAFVITGGLIALLIWFTLGAKRFSDMMSRETRLIELQEQMSELKEANQKHEGISHQLLLALQNIQAYLRSYNELKIRKGDIKSHFHVEFIQRIVDAIAADVKGRPGERHRCAYWLREEEELVLVNASSGFPSHYLSNRRLSIERSLAGKSFRRREIVKTDNVEDEADWQPNPQSNSPYKAVLCIPIGDFGVITLDALNPIDEHAKNICEAYCQIIISVMHEYIKAFTEEQFSHTQEEVASATQIPNN